MNKTSRKNGAQIDRKHVRCLGPHILEVHNSAVYCSCNYSEGTSTGRMAMHLATSHQRENLVWRTSIDDRR